MNMFRFRAVKARNVVKAFIDGSCTSQDDEIDQGEDLGWLIFNQEGLKVSALLGNPRKVNIV